MVVTCIKEIYRKIYRIFIPYKNIKRELVYIALNLANYQRTVSHIVSKL